MANQKITMTELKLLLQRLSRGESSNKIKDELHMSKKTVLKHKNLAQATGQSYETLLTFSEADLVTILQPSSPVPQTDTEKHSILLPVLKEYAKRLKNGKYINKLVLWEEYQPLHKGDTCGYYQYTQFKYHLNEYIKSQK